MKILRLYLCLLLLIVVMLSVVSCGQTKNNHWEPKKHKNSETTRHDVPAQASVHSSGKKDLKINLDNINAYQDASEFIEDSMLSLKDGVSKYLACCFVEEIGIVTKNGESKYVMESELQAYRTDGWFVKNYGGLYELKEQLEEYISGKRGQYGIYIKNLYTDENLIINDGQYSAASIIKLFVMAGVYNEAGEDRLTLDSTVKSKLNSMITISDNYSSNFLVGRMGHGNYSAGFDAENKNSKKLGCVLTQHKSLFSGCGDYVSYGRNLVSPVDCGILLEKIYDGTLVNKQYSKEMLSMLKNQQRINKIPAGIPEKTECANKTGEASGIESDVAIVYSPDCDYIICVITNGAVNGANDIKNISEMTYNYFN